VAALAVRRLWLGAQATRSKQASVTDGKGNSVEGGRGRTLAHREFPDLSGGDPRRPALAALLETLGRSGPILVYSRFERSVLRQLAPGFPGDAAAIEAAMERLVDLLPIAKAHYYHTAMQGSWSIHSILPTIGVALH
jgi:hypothetical protein